MSEIRLFAGNFAPNQWALCNGALLSIAENSALFSLLGTMYGGDGQTTFALPDFRGRVAVGTGQGGGLSVWDIGQVSGTETVTLLSSNLPLHTHPATATATPRGNGTSAGSTTPVSNYYAVAPSDLYIASSNSPMLAAHISINSSVAGSNSPHDNMMPYLAINYIICVEGVYPSRA